MRYRQYKYKVLSFGLINRLATYQCYINNVLFKYLDDFYMAYLNNILIYSKNLEEHKIHVYKVLEKLRLTGL
jgi:dTDP-4-amino-4,6-dideoxygalactose transaminase